MPPPPAESVGSFLGALRASRLLSAAQLAEVERRANEAIGAPQSLAQLLLQWGWATRYQMDQLFLGRGHNLVLGAYHLLDRIGEGATGYVFKARHTAMQRIVALKVIRPDLLNDEEVVARFYREVRSLSQLNHPNIVHAYDAGAFGATHYLVMEYIEGTDLDRLVRQTGPLPVGQAVDYIYQATMGLQCAHEQGLVHRDVKPSNLLVTLAPALAASAGERSGSPAPPSVVKILDLGLARGPRTAHEQTAASLTQAGKGMMGTPDYLAPEQALDFSQADIRSDLYSLGCVFYYLLTGQPPFPGGTLAEKLMRHQQAEAPPLSRFRSDVPPALAAVIGRLLAKEPARRFATPIAFAEVLVRAFPGMGTSPARSSLDVSTVIEQASLTAWQGTRTATAPVAHFAPPSPGPASPAVALQEAPTTRRLPLAVRRRRWLLFNTAGIGVLGGLSLLFWALLNVRTTPPTASTGPDIEVSNHSPALQELLVRLRKARSAGEDTERLRRDLIAFRTQNAGSPEAFVASTRLKELPSPFDALDPKAIPIEERLPWYPSDLVGVVGRHEAMAWGHIGALAFSSDGKLVATGSTDGVVRVWDSGTLHEKAALKGHTGIVNGVAFGPGPVLASVDEFNALHVWDLADLARPKEIGNLKTADHSYHCVCVTFSPDGKLIAAGGYDGRVKLFDVAPKAVKFRAFLTGHAGDLYTVAFSPDGKTLYSGGSDGLRVWDVVAPTPTSASPVITAPVRSLAVLDENRVALCVTSPAGLSLWQFPRDEAPRELGVLQAKTATYGPHRVAVSADGEWLVSNVIYDSSIQVWRKEGNKFALSTTLTSCNGEVGAFAFSPDGKTLAVGGSSHCINVWSLDKESGKVSPAPQEGLRPGGLWSTPVSPLGDTVVFASDMEPLLHFWKIGEAKPRPLVSAPFPTLNKRWAMGFAPDGSSFYTLQVRNVAQWNWTSGPPRIVSELSTSCNTDVSLTQLVLSANGKLLAAASHFEPTIWSWDLSRGKPIERPPVKAPRGGCGSLTVAPDGNTMAALFDERTSDAQGNVSYHWTIRLWDLTAPTPTELPRLMENTTSRPMYPQFSPDGKQLGVLFPEDGKIDLYDLAAEKLRPRTVFYAAPGTTLRSFLFTPDGRQVIGAGNGPQALLTWDVATGKVLRSWGALPCLFNNVTLSSDGRHLLTANGNGTAYIFRLPPPPGGLIAR